MGNVCAYMQEDPFWMTWVRASQTCRKALSGWQRCLKKIEDTNYITIFILKLPKLIKQCMKQGFCLEFMNRMEKPQI
jgi:hypothetical protein